MALADSPCESEKEAELALLPVLTNPARLLFTAVSSIGIR